MVVYNSSLNLNRRFYWTEAHTRCGAEKLVDARAISAAGLHTLVLTPAVYQTDLLSEL